MNTINSISNALIGLIGVCGALRVAAVFFSMATGGTDPEVGIKHIKHTLIFCVMGGMAFAIKSIIASYF